MPELPEVETVANGVNRHVRGDVIVSAWFSSHQEPFRTPRSVLAEALAGRRIAGVRRVGKHIVIDLEAKEGDSAGDDSAGRDLAAGDSAVPDRKGRRRSGARLGARSPHTQLLAPQLLVHLGMTGQLLVSAADVPQRPHTHAVLHLGSGRELRFVDPRRFGRLALAAEPFRGPGTEPLTISLDDFVLLFRGRKLSIKSALLNQKLLHGVGNIYADESLFRAGIRPTRVAGRLSRAKLGRLRKALQSVLKSAIRAGGSSVSDYVDADGERGLFQVRHCVYGREGQACRVCGTPIRRIVLGGRGTHYCPHCQT